TTAPTGPTSAACCAISWRSWRSPATPRCRGASAAAWWPAPAWCWTTRSSTRTCPGRCRSPRCASSSAWATQFLSVDETLPVIETAQPAARGPVLVMGPGTGLGSAVLLPRAGHAQVLPTEAGQIALAPGNEREIAILRVLARGRAYVSYEDALSGPGLLKLYHALCELRG